MRQFLLLSAVLLSCAVQDISAHGRLVDPPNRSSLWRLFSTSPANYDDDANFCGGAHVQWEVMDGKCGVCGDRYDDPHPQNNENTGKYGVGRVVKQYQSGSVIDVEVLLTTNHKGYFNFSLCVLEDPSKPESGEGCFQPLTLANGNSKYSLTPSEKVVKTQVKLPDGLTCDRCVLRWHYNTGNSWGVCEDGTGAIGCGAQETFRSCSDIAIV